MGVVAVSGLPILICGESGTGKDLITTAVHRHSPRHGGPFVGVNWAALPPTLLESELFGHRRGAFTGAVSDRAGLVASADGGTLFLDEIGEMATELQAKLLHVLQSGEYRAVGSDHVETADVRVVAATNRDLADAVAQGRFRQDLYFRLKGVVVTLPSTNEKGPAKWLGLLLSALERYLSIFAASCGIWNASTESNSEKEYFDVKAKCGKSVNGRFFA